jgi:hypothetical protein
MLNKVLPNGITAELKYSPGQRDTLINGFEETRIFKPGYNVFVLPELSARSIPFFYPHYRVFSWQGPYQLKKCIGEGGR